MENTLRSLIQRLGRNRREGRTSRRATTLSYRPDRPVYQVSVAGDLNGWSCYGHPLRRRSDGTWTVTLDLAPGTYRYRFLVDNSEWVLDPASDPVPNSDGGYDSVLTVAPEATQARVAEEPSLQQEQHA